MTAIWQNDGSAWRLLSPAGFPDEAALHGLVEQAPHILPLAGVPQLVVVGREVFLGANRADLIAVEATGRLAIIEIKMAWNPEARSAVVTQILTYTAFLRGMDLATLEQVILAPHLRKRGFDGLAAAVSASDQTGSFDPTGTQRLGVCRRLLQVRDVQVEMELLRDIVRRPRWGFVVEGQLECQSCAAVAPEVHPRVVTVVGDPPAEQGCVELRQLAWLVGIEHNEVEPDVRP